MKNKAEAALARVLTNLSKAVLSISCVFNFLSPKDDAVGYTYRRKTPGKGNKEVAEIFINRDNAMFFKLNDVMKNVAAFGVAVHEMLHQKFTDFILFEKIMKKTPSDKINIFKTVFNIFEDSRIEYFANQVFGGKALAALKYCINLTWEESPEIDKTSHPLNQVLNALIQYGDTGRIKGDFSDDDTRETFLYCCELFDKAIVCTKCEECINLSTECTNFLFNKYLKALSQALKDNMLSGGGGKGEDAKEQKNGSQTANAKQQNRQATKQQQNKKNQQNSSSQSSANEQNNNQSQNGDGNSNEEDKNGNEDENNNSGKTSGEEPNENAENTSSGNDDEEGEGSDNSDNNSSNSNDSSNNEGGEEGQENGDEANSEGEDGEPQSNSTSSNASNSNNNSQNSEGDNSGDTSNDNSDEEGQEAEFNEFVFDDEDIEDFAEELEGKMEAAAAAIESEVKTSEGDVYTFRLEDAECSVCCYRQIPCDENTFRYYQEYANSTDVSGLSDELAKDMEVILKTRPTGWERSKSGKLNIKRWNDPNFNSPYIFDKRLSNESSIAVSILIDESGSMSGDRINHVRHMACVLAEAFLKLGIKFNILGHTGGEVDDDTNSIREYSDFDSDVFEQVVTIDARDYNYDGASIKVATDKLAKREERNKLMFVLTDGASHNVANTELAIRDANKIATVVGVALACERDRNVIEKMYGDKFVMVRSMNDLMDTIIDKLKEVSSMWS